MWIHHIIYQTLFNLTLCFFSWSSFPDQWFSELYHMLSCLLQPSEFLLDVFILHLYCQSLLTQWYWCLQQWSLMMTHLSPSPCKQSTLSFHYKVVKMSNPLSNPRLLVTHSAPTHNMLASTISFIYHSYFGFEQVSFFCCSSNCHKML